MSGERLGLGALFGGFGIYTALAGAAGPCVLWLAGRAQGHTLSWFLLTSAKIALVMVAVVAFLSPVRRFSWPARCRESAPCWAPRS